MKADTKKYVVILAHADGWGALSANTVIAHMRENYPGIQLYLIVSQATKNKDGEIATKLDDLKIPRELKETNLLEYFSRIDVIYAGMRPEVDVWREIMSTYGKPDVPSDKPPEYYADLGHQAARYMQVELPTFNQLAKTHCADGEVHYTTRGGLKGGEEVATVIEELEKRHGYGPEVLLSVDTMAILPAHLLERYDCFSTHPGPLDTIKIEGMQGTLRSLANEVFYKANGDRLLPDDRYFHGERRIKGTLFLQHPELDKGPPIRTALTLVPYDMCAYQARDELYHALINEMLELVPVLLDKDARAELIEEATREKAAADAQPHQRIAELTAEELTRWQGRAVAFPDSSKPWGVEVVQNEIIDPVYFRRQMCRFYPGTDREFGQVFDAIYNLTVERLDKQQDDRLDDPWARLATGDTNIIIRHHDPKTGKVIATFKNSRSGRVIVRRYPKNRSDYTPGS